MVAKKDYSPPGVSRLAQQCPKDRDLIQRPPNCELFRALERIVHHVNDDTYDLPIRIPDFNSHGLGQFTPTGSDLILVEQDWRKRGLTGGTEPRVILEPTLLDVLCARRERTAEQAGARE